MEHIKGSIKIQLAKFLEAFTLPWPTAFLIPYLCLRSIPLGKHSLSPYEIVTGHPINLDEGAYESAILKGDILHYC